MVKPYLADSDQKIWMEKDIFNVGDVVGQNRMALSITEFETLDDIKPTF